MVATGFEQERAYKLGYILVSGNPYLFPRRSARSIKLRMEILCALFAGLTNGIFTTWGY